MIEHLFRLTAFGSINMKSELEKIATQNGTMRQKNGVQMDLPSPFQEYMMQDATYIQFTKEPKQELNQGLNRVCAWCPEPNELVGNDAQLVFPFYYDFGRDITHGICYACDKYFHARFTPKYEKKP